MNSDDLALALAESLARHQTRGLVDGATGMGDVVIHGRIDLRAVAEDLYHARLAELRPARRSWANWFLERAGAERECRRRAKRREALAQQLESEADPAKSAIARLRMRDLDD